MKEHIVCAAIRWLTPIKPTIITGSDHSDCIHKAIDKKIKMDTNAIEGFMTSEDNFVGRKEAYKIALDAEQVIYPGDPEVLYSYNFKSLKTEEDAG